MYSLDNGLLENRIGMTVSKKVGNSVIRNRIRRLVREGLRMNEPMLKTGFDIVVVARVGANGRSYIEINGALMHLFGLHDMLDVRG